MKTTIISLHPLNENPSHQSITSLQPTHDNPNHQSITSLQLPNENPSHQSVTSLQSPSENQYHQSQLPVFKLLMKTTITSHNYRLSTSFLKTQSRATVSLGRHLVPTTQQPRLTWTAPSHLNSLVSPEGAWGVDVVPAVVCRVSAAQSQPRGVLVCGAFRLSSSQTRTPIPPAGARETSVKRGGGLKS